MSTEAVKKPRPAQFELWLGIDPGQTSSGVVLIRSPRTDDRFCEQSFEMENEKVLDFITHATREVLAAEAVVIEDIAPTMVPLGHALADTLRWIGRFHERACAEARTIGVIDAPRIELIPRPKVRAILGVRDDGGTRQAVLSMFKPCGAGSVPQVGVKKRPGPLFGVSGHAWQAIALLMAYRYQRLRAL